MYEGVLTETAQTLASLQAGEILDVPRAGGSRHGGEDERREREENVRVHGVSLIAQVDSLCR